MSETFLSRWSRRKRAASIPPPQGEGGEDRRSEPGGGLTPPPGERADSSPHPGPLAASGEGETVRSASGEGTSPSVERAENPPHPDPLPASGQREFDPASLPPIESIDAGTDVSAFLRPGVPADLAQAALRRAWVTDPAIRDFVGLAENAWDFNAPDGVPGFGPLRAIDDVQRLAAQVIGALPSAAPQDAEKETQVLDESMQAVEPPPPPALEEESRVAAADDAALQKDAPGHDA